MRTHSHVISLSLSLSLTYSSRKGTETLQGTGTYGWKSKLKENTEETQTWIRGHKRKESKVKLSPANGRALAALETRSPDDGSLGRLWIFTIFHYLSW